ncbi:MAG: PaaI family thioesterase [Sphingomonas sp.]|nr:phenylacetic acid degradation protein [Zymomonas sp.]MBA4041282.1 phenylacetic acid degradation protein [Sphingobium sp.]MBA4771472.1 PaaI family thioesterase [Sphingomonas sp.]PZP19607.1 MAG: phenylacetic acid degradation protein [Sphingomonas hengshuiensis]
MTWELADSTRFNSLFGPFLLRVEHGTARVRMTPRHLHSNLSGKMHGGALMSFVDMAIFAAARGFGLIEAGTAVTLDFSAQFIGRAELDEPVEARVELLRETGRLLFLRGLVVQPDGAAGDAPVLSFAATIRKPSAR